MKTDLRILFSSRFLTFTLLCSFFIRLLSQILLPKNATSFARDEGTYAFLTDYVSNGFPVQDFPSYGPSLYNTSKTLILPSSALSRLGLNELLAIRIVSSTYGFLALLILNLCFVAICAKRISNVDKTQISLNRVQKTLIIIYALMPSNVLWSVLGLRESSIQLFTLLTTYFILKVLEVSKKSKFAYSVLACLALTLAFGARRETTLVYSCALVIASLYLLLKKREWATLAIVFMGVLIGQLYTATPTLITVEEKYFIPKTEMQNPLSSGINDGSQPKPYRKCQKIGREIVIDKVSYICRSNTQVSKSITDPFSSTLDHLSVLDQLAKKRELNRQGANSSLREDICTKSTDEILANLNCNLRELPYRLVAFLLRPILVLDSGSNFLFYAGLENVLWSIIILFYTFMSIKGFKFKSHPEKAILLLLHTFVIAYSVGASLYEGNLGTAFRHKSSILWPIVLALLFLIKNSNFPRMRSDDSSKMRKSEE